MRCKVIALAVLALAGCASSGVIPTGKDALMISKSSAGGGFVSGASVKADLYVEANKYCADRGMAVETIEATAVDPKAFSHGASAELHFRCAPKQ